MQLQMRHAWLCLRMFARQAMDVKEKDALADGGLVEGGGRLVEGLEE
jgi:hypothetical protein